MIAFSARPTATGIVLFVRGALDGSGAWRLVRLARRLVRAGPVTVDLALDGLLPFAAVVLGQQLPRARLRLCADRPEHVGVLRLAGLSCEVAAEPPAFPA